METRDPVLDQVLRPTKLCQYVVGNIEGLWTAVSSQVLNQIVIFGSSSSYITKPLSLRG
jgi:hypothetical protein